MSGWTYPGFGDAPAAGLAVGAGVQIWVQAYAGAAAETNTKAEIRTMPATAAMTTIGVRFRSMNDGW